MKIILITLVFISQWAHAAETAMGETVGGPFVGACSVVTKGTSVDQFSFNTKPGDKVAIRIDNGNAFGDYYVQVINDSFANNLSVASFVVGNSVGNPPRLCGKIGQFDQCDFIKPKPTLPRRTTQKDTQRLFPMAGPLALVQEPESEALGKIVESYERKILVNNDGFQDRIELQIKQDTKLVCDIQYVNLF